MILRSHGGGSVYVTTPPRRAEPVLVLTVEGTGGDEKVGQDEPGRRTPARGLRTLADRAVDELWGRVDTEPPEPP